jgi:hypothetical protein
MNAYAIVRDAITNRESIAAEYDGHHREMSPHVIGTKRGRAQALCYQYGGTSSSGPLGPVGSPDNWRCVVIDKLVNARPIKGVWHTAPNHTRPQTCVGEIDVEVTC